MEYLCQNCDLFVDDAILTLAGGGGDLSTYFGRVLGVTLNL
jgi:hypothetical protein